MFYCNTGKFSEHIFCQYTASRIIRRNDHNGPCLIRQFCANLFKVDLKSIFFYQVIRYRFGTQKIWHIDVIDPHGIWNQNLIPCVQQSGQHSKNCFGQTDSDKYFGWLICDAVFPSEFVGNGAAQFHKAKVRRVMNSALLQRLASRLFDIVRRIEVRTADLEVDDLLARPLHGQCLFH
mgnify:CR=1 FL=1